MINRKEEKKPNYAPLWIFGGIVFVFGWIFVFYNLGFEKQLEFTIYEEGCEERFYFENIAMGLDCMFPFNPKEEGRMIEFKDIIDKYCKPNLNFEDRCKMVEVDEIIIENKSCVTGTIDKEGTREFYRVRCPTYNFVDKFASWIQHTSFPECEYCMNYNKLTQTPIEYREITISKQDLTIERLHTTCECEVRSEEPPKIKGISSLWRTCLTYKCDSYFIEVTQ